MAKEAKEAKEKKPGAAPAEAPAAPKKKRSKWLLIAPALVVVLAAGGAGAWYGLRPAPAGDHAAAAKQAPKPDKTKPPIFVALETFTVNLQPEAGEHLLQATFSLKIADAVIEQALKLQMPDIRSRLLLLLSSKRPSELTTVAGKQQLAAQIAAEVNRVLNPEGETPAPDKPAEKADKPSETATEKSADNATEKSAEKASEGSAEPAVQPTASSAAAQGPVLSVFFASFIIQ